jgi:selenide, water dikinase
MADIRPGRNSKVLVGPGDDAGVCLFEDRAIVETVDVISPLVNDPFTFGEISATNSLSDIYAMGGKPVSAMAVAGFPACEYGPEVLTEIMNGAVSVLDRFGVALLGGHSFDNNEIKFGLAVSGTIDKDRILRATGAGEGDLLVLTKPLGIGILTTALKGKVLTEADISNAIDWMRTMNDKASEIALKAGATACTDVTGFGLLGHALNMLKDGKMDFVIDSSKIPVMDRVMEMIDAGMVPGGANRNLEYVSGHLEFSPRMTYEQKLMLCDPQTAGGLLIAVKQRDMWAFEESNIFHKVVGGVIPGTGRILVL